MTTILLADGDELALRKLLGELALARPDWQFLGTTRGIEVLQQVSNVSIDCIVTDVDLQDMSGFELLSKLQANYPHIIRITLSADLDHEVVLESTRANHRFINRAVSTDSLVSAIDASLRLQHVLGDDALESCMSEVSSLPSLPEIYQQMVSELTSSQSSLLNVGRIIETDAALTATVLKIVNSAFYGLNQRVESVSQGVALLGVHLIKNITLTAKVFSQFKGNSLDLARLRQLNDSANRTGALSNQLARLAGVPRTVIDHAQIAGMLSNIGQLVVLSRLNDKSFQSTNIHSDLQGAYLLKLWRLPDPVIEAVALQQDTPAKATPELTPLIILHSIRFLENHFTDESNREACQEYLKDIVPDRTATLWIDAFCDLQALTSHRDQDQSRVA